MNGSTRLFLFCNRNRNSAKSSTGDISPDHTKLLKNQCKQVSFFKSGKPHSMFERTDHCKGTRLLLQCKEQGDRHYHQRE